MSNIHVSVVSITITTTTTTKDTESIECRFVTSIGGLMDWLIGWWVFVCQSCSVVGNERKGNDRENGNRNGKSERERVSEMALCVCACVCVIQKQYQIDNPKNVVGVERPFPYLRAFVFFWSFLGRHSSSLFSSLLLLDEGQWLTVQLYGGHSTSIHNDHYIPVSPMIMYLNK